MTKSKFEQLMADSNHLDKVIVDMEKNKKTSYGDDPRYWKPEVDKAGNGYAIIRFLPVPPQDWGKPNAATQVKLFHHGFKGPGGQWYIENSRTTLGEADPVSELNSSLWNTEIEAKQNIARNQKRKLNYISGIFVVKDEKHPENEGKVFLYKYGPKIYEKIEEATKPPFPDQPRFNPFHFLEGANFKLKIRNGDGGFRSYNSSEFDKPSPLLEGNTDAISKLWDSQHSILDEVAPDKFKTYAELKKRLETVLGTVGMVDADDDDAEVTKLIPPKVDKPRPQPVAAVAKPAAPVAAAEEAFEDDDDTIKLFQKLAS